MTHTNNQSRRQSLERHRPKLEAIKKDHRVPQKSVNKARKGVRLMSRSLHRLQ